MNYKTFLFVVSIVSLLFIAQLSILQFPIVNANNVETRYMRSDTQTINGLLAYKLETTQSSSALSVSSSAGSTSLYGTTIRPTSDVLAGFPTQYPASSYHYQKVDDVVADDTDTMVCTSGEDSTVYYDRYGHTAYGGASTIAYVKVTFRAMKGGVGSHKATFSAGIYIGTTYYWTVGTGATNVWTTDSWILYLNPNTNLPWTSADIAGLQLAIKGSSLYYLEGYYPAYCTQIYMEVYTYTDIDTIYSIDVVKRTSAGAETAIGTKVASTTYTLAYYFSNPGLDSGTWVCPQTALETTDSIVVRVYLKIGAGAWNTVRNFTTGQLGAISLDAATWTVYYYLGASADASYMYSVFWHGKSTYNSAIANFQWTAVVTGYKLNLRVMDWNLADAISGAKVTMNNGTNNVKTSNGGGWANYTSVSGTVTVSVTYYSKNVNGTSITVSADTTKNLKCKLYDVNIIAKPNNGIGILSGVNVTAYNDTGTASGKIKSGITVDYTGTITLTNLPNATLRFILRVKSDYSVIIANTTKTISSDGQTESILGTQNYATVSMPCPLLIFIGSILSWCFNHKKVKGKKWR